MLITKIIAKNFKTYRELELDLTVNEEQPIILIGGENGGGKTTFLDAIQLVLYGKHAKCSNRAGTAYGSFLASCKNRFAPKDAEVMLSLSFIRFFEIPASTQPNPLMAACPY